MEAGALEDHVQEDAASSIDDERESMKYYVMALERSEFEVQQLGVTPRVLDHVRSTKPPDAVILD